MQFEQLEVPKLNPSDNITANSERKTGNLQLKSEVYVWFSLIIFKTFLAHVSTKTFSFESTFTLFKDVLIHFAPVT